MIRVIGEWAGKRMRLQVFSVFTTLVFCAAAAAGQATLSPSQLECKIGPVTKTYGNTPWLVYACNDDHSLTLVSAPGSKAMPFVFMFHWENGGYQLTVAGTGNKTATDAAFAEIRSFTGDTILKLLEETKASFQQPKKSN